MIRFVAALCVAALPAFGQHYVQVTDAPGALLRGLDKMNGATDDLELKQGESVMYGALRITLNQCRYPVGNPAGDAYAELLIVDTASGTPAFSGWMIASSPALSAMDHARYDIWVMRCTT